MPELQGPMQLNIKCTSATCSATARAIMLPDSAAHSSWVAPYRQQRTHVIPQRFSVALSSNTSRQSVYNSIAKSTCLQVGVSCLRCMPSYSGDNLPKVKSPQEAQINMSMIQQEHGCTPA